MNIGNHSLVDHEQSGIINQTNKMIITDGFVDVATEVSAINDIDLESEIIKIDIKTKVSSEYISLL